MSVACTSILSLSEISQSRQNIQLYSKFNKDFIGQSLGKNVCQHFLSRNIIEYYQENCLALHII